MKLYDTLLGAKDNLHLPLSVERVNVFVCGPTVYDYQHIGNGKTQLVFDLFVRFLRSEGYKVFYLQNITDIDDKIILRAKERGIAPAKLADEFYKIYREDMKALGIRSINKYAHATRYIKQIVNQIKALLEKGYAYKAEDGYYFNIAKFSDYGKLSRRTVAAAEDGVSRIDESVSKINKGDFALWKFWSGEADEPYWNTSLGKGRPGWHIEDTAITEKFFGPQYDIHGGGLDLKFPHHEAELAQQEAASGKTPFVKFWMHSGLVSINGAKMSKSLGNFITIRDFLKKCSPETFRYIVLMHHYRSPINFTDSLQAQAEESMRTMREFLAKLEFIKKKNKNLKNSGEIELRLKKYSDQWSEALRDDFNTPAGLASIFELMNSMHNNIWSLSPQNAGDIAKFVYAKLKIFGISLKSSAIPGNIKKLAKDRVKSRANKQFIQSDELRKQIEGLGYKVEDTPLGQLILNNS